MRIALIVLAILIISILTIFFKNSENKSAVIFPASVSSLSQEQEESPKTITENLDTPWGLIFLPDRSMLVTERPGRVRLIDKSGKLDPRSVATIKKAEEIGEGGLLGIILHPNFSENKFIYLYYTYSGDDDQTLNRVVRLRYENGKLADEKIIIDKIPGAPNHNGGRIKFGPDNFLYITTGDAQNPSQAQNKNSLAGKTLRVTDEGKIPPDNPFKNAVYSYGHRNPQGLAWDDKGRLWATEHGRSGLQSGLDELNLIEKGKNYGWSVIQGDEKRSGMETPKINSGATTTWAPAGLAYLNGSFYFGGLKGQILYEVVVQGEKLELKKHLQNEFGRLRDVVVGPDGWLYVTTSNQDGRGEAKPGDDKIIKIDPNKL